MLIMRNVKKFAAIALAAAMTVSLCACGKDAKSDDKPQSTESQSVTQSDADIVSEVVELYIRDSNEDKIEDFKTTSVKVYTADDIAADSTLADYDLNDNDIVFAIVYELKIADGVDPIEFTAATGEVDGQWVRDKSNCGVLKYGEDGEYTVSNFGTGF